MTKYSFKDLALLVKGIPMSGFANGDDVIQGARRVDAFSDSVGADGKMLVTQNADRSGSIVLKFQQGSTSNVTLASFFDQQERGVFEALDVALVNTISGERMTGTKGYITKPSDTTRGTNANNNEWTIVVEDYDAVFGSLPVL